jgi:hypothetical protein
MGAVTEHERNRMIRQKVSESYATIGAREDIDGAVPLVAFCPNREAAEDALDELGKAVDPPRKGRS